MKRVCTVAAAALLLAGCVQPTPTPSVTSTPSPTFLCTPEAGGAEAPCTELQHKEMQEREALYVEAEQVYRKYQAEFLKSLQKGGASTMPASLAEIIADDDVAKSVLDSLKYFEQQGWRVVGSGASIEWIVRRPTATMNGSLVSLEACTDGRNTVIYKGKRKLEPAGLVGIETVFFGTAPGKLKIVGAESREVKSCEL